MEGNGVEPIAGGEYEGMPSNGNQVSVRALIVSVGLSLVLVFGMMYVYFIPKLVSKADFDTNIGNIVAELNAVKTSVAPLIGLPAQVSNLSTSIGTANSELATIRAGGAGYATQGSLTALQTTVATLQTDLNTVKANVGDDTALQTQVDSLQASLTSLVGEISALAGRVVELENSSSSTSTSTTTTTTLASDTLNGLTATIEPYSHLFTPYNPMIGTSVQTMAIKTDDNGIVAGDGLGGGSTTFQLVLENNTGQTIKDLIVTLVFGIFDSDYKSQTLPTVEKVDLASFGYPMVNGLSGSKNYLYFSGGGYAYIGFSQAVGDRSYYCTLTIPAAAGATADTTYLLYPQIKVVSFTKVP